MRYLVSLLVYLVSLPFSSLVARPFCKNVHFQNNLTLLCVRKKGASCRIFCATKGSAVPSGGMTQRLLRVKQELILGLTTLKKIRSSLLKNRIA